MEKAIQSKEDSLEYAIARDQLIQRHELSEDPIVESTDDYWNQFVNCNNKLNTFNQAA